MSEVVAAIIDVFVIAINKKLGQGKDWQSIDLVIYI